MKIIPNVVLLLEGLQNTHPDAAIPAEDFPIPQTFCIRFQFFIRRIVTKSHIPRETHVGARHAAPDRAAIEPSGAIVRRMTGGFVGNFVSQGLPEQPKMQRTGGGKLRQPMTDVYTAVADAHSQNVL